VGSFAILRSYTLLWLLSLAALGATLALIALPAKSENTPQRTPDRADERPHRTRDWAFPLSLAAAAALITLLAHRPDGDDSLYLNVIVTSLDFPGESLLRRDGLHGIPQLPLAYVVYRAHSFELLNAILARFSGLSPLAIYYLLLPPVFAALVIAGHWIVLRRLNPSLALPALGVTFAVMLLWGDTHWSPGNFAFVRLHQGKAIFASAMVPIIVFYALRFSERGDARSWTGLFLAQVAAVGLTSSAVFLAPATAGLTLIAGWQRDAASTKRVLLGTGASLHAVLVILLVIAEGAGTGGMASSVHPFSSDFEGNFEAVLGHGGRSYIALLSLLVAPLFVDDARRRRQFAFFLFFFVLLFLNPWTGVWLSSLLERYGSAIVTWRFFWIVPLPLLVALSAAGATAAIPRRGVLPVGIIVLVLGVGAYGWYQEPWAISAANRTRLQPPGYKVDGGYSVAKAIRARTPPRARILAPEEVAKWVPTFREHPYPELARGLYALALEPYMGRGEFLTRMLLHDFVSGRNTSPELLPEMLRLIVARDIYTVAFSSSLPLSQDFASALQQRGFHGKPVGGYEVWSRSR